MLCTSLFCLMTATQNSQIYNSTNYLKLKLPSFADQVATKVVVFFLGNERKTQFLGD